MADEWRITHKRMYNYAFNKRIWYYVLERKKRFLFWDYWKRIDREDYYYYENSLLLDKYKQFALHLLQKKRLEILEDEDRKFTVVKEWT